MAEEWREGGFPIDMMVVVDGKGVIVDGYLGYCHAFVMVFVFF